MTNSISTLPSRPPAKARGENAPTPQAAMALAKSKAYQDAAGAPATLKAYATDWANFNVWCTKHGFTPMPATPEVVGAFLAAAGEGYALPTLRRRVAAIARACRIAGHPLDTNAPAIRETLRGIGRKYGTPPRRSAALTIADMRKLVRACGATLAGARDRALFLVGFAGALRRSELVGMNVGDITWTDDGLVLLITHSKTDAEGAGARIGINRGRATETCPVTALHAWLDEAGIIDGPVFRKVNRGGAVERSRLTAGAVRQILVHRAGEANLPNTWAEPVSPHGLRADFVRRRIATACPVKKSWATPATEASLRCGPTCGELNSETRVLLGRSDFDGVPVRRQIC